MGWTTHDLLPGRAAWLRQVLKVRASALQVLLLASPGQIGPTDAAQEPADSASTDANGPMAKYLSESEALFELTAQLFRQTTITPPGNDP